MHLRFCGTTFVKTAVYLTLQRSILLNLDILHEILQKFWFAKDVQLSVAFYLNELCYSFSTLIPLLPCGVFEGQDVPWKGSLFKPSEVSLAMALFRENNLHITILSQQSYQMSNGVNKLVTQLIKLT